MPPTPITASTSARASPHLVVKDGVRPIADTKGPVVLFESGFAPRWYVPRQDIVESALIPVPKAVRILAFMPHMHVRGKSFRYDVILPGGETRTLLEVPRYDFNWQLSYRYAEPPLIPAGSKVRATGWFDNSDKNPANPDPKKLVRWGPQTTDEMMLGYVEYYIPDAPPPKVASK